MTKQWIDLRRQKVPPEREADVSAGVRALRDALDLRDLRAVRGLTQVELAARLGKSQGNVSDLERREDVYLSSLREYVEALGGRLEVTAVFDDERQIVAVGGPAPVREAAAPYGIGHPRNAGKPTSIGVPGAIIELFSAWRVAGAPAQAGIPWPRQAWVEAFPGHADLLRGLPTLLDRDAVRAICADANTDARSAEAAFVTVMAWGYGRVGYGPHRTQRVLSETAGARERLSLVAQTLEDGGALAAYGRLTRRDDCRLRGLGPAFGTKYLYFCQPSGQDVTALILDDLVASWLRRETELDLRSDVWSESTYRRYLDHMHDWASILGCEPDELEFCIFQAMAAERGGQWAASRLAASDRPRLRSHPDGLKRANDAAGRWTSDVLFQELKRYERDCNAAGLRPKSVFSYVDYGGRFLRWRVGDYRPRHASGSVHRPSRGSATMDDLMLDLVAYEADLRGAGLRPNAINTYVANARQFVRWLGGAFEPGVRL